MTHEQFKAAYPSSCMYIIGKPYHTDDDTRKTLYTPNEQALKAIEAGNAYCIVFKNSNRAFIGTYEDFLKMNKNDDSVYNAVKASSKDEFGCIVYCWANIGSFSFYYRKK